MKKQPIPAKRDMIIKLAYDVFDAHGFQGVGIDTLLANSGISKRTVYKHFRSKEELIAAAITYYQNKIFNSLATELSRRAKDAKGKLLALFDIKQEELSAQDYAGCFAINARLAYKGEHTEIHDACAVFLQEVEKLILGLCKEAQCPQPKTTAMKIMVLFEGTIVYGQSHRNPAIAAASKDIVRDLLKPQNKK